MPNTNTAELIKKALEILGDQEPDLEYETEEIGKIKSGIDEFIETIPESRNLANETLAFCQALQKKLKELEKTLLDEAINAVCDERSTAISILSNTLSYPDAELRARLNDWLYEMNKGESINEDMRVRLMVAQARPQKPQMNTIRMVLEKPDAMLRESLEQLVDPKLSDQNPE